MPTTRNTLLKDYFTFSKKERRAVILLAVLAIIFSLLPTLFPVLVKDESDFIVDEETQQQLAAMRTNEKEAAAKEEDEQKGDWYQPKSKSYPQYSSGEKGELFFFDPNTASAEEWKRLGVKDKTIQTILKFRSKGGSFKKPEDISRIYGLSVKDADRLLPFVKIEKEHVQKPTNSVESTTVSTTESKPVFSEKRSKPIDINKADTTEWKTLKGIGSFYAKKIVGFRDKLGGFYSVQQVAETYGLPDSTFQTIQPFLLVNTSAVKQINLNAVTAEELKAHPYIKGTIANAIINYRTNHGNFSSVEQLQNIGAIDEELYRKIAPYLTIQ
jgi:competence protein ComEA